jgi:hypothetical protein
MNANAVDSTGQIYRNEGWPGPSPPQTASLCWLNARQSGGQRNDVTSNRSVFYSSTVSL